MGFFQVVFDGVLVSGFLSGKKFSFIFPKKKKFQKKKKKEFRKPVVFLTGKW